MPSERIANHHTTTTEVLRLFRARGQSQYGQEAVSQEQHALQSALFAEQSGASVFLIAAALLHDIGHLLHTFPDDAPEQGLDDRHEALAAHWLAGRFPPEVVEPVRWHVAAKRYLCTAEPEYLKQLSPPSRLSLELQGSLMSVEELRIFRAQPFFEAAIALRRWDDAAKVPNLATPSLSHFAAYLDRALVAGGQEPPACQA